MDKEEKNRNPEEVSQETITNDDVARYYEMLLEYSDGKKSIDNKATANQEWWRMRHWNQMDSKEGDGEEKAVSAWLFNSIINKHADIMDNYPKPNILPRDAASEEEARMLTNIIPVIDDRTGYEQVYDDKALDLLIDGGCITSVLWDNSLNDGLGDISVNIVDIHNMFWKPGIEDIQDSPAIFVARLYDNETLEKQYPQLNGKTGGMRMTVEYINKDENVDENKQTEVWDMYYKKTIDVPVMEDPESGKQITAPKQLLHFVKFCSGELLYASENDPGLKNKGLYDHGKYPFVVTPLFKIKESPWGFGYVDIMKSPQARIDVLDQLIVKNAAMASTSRWAVKEGCDIDTDIFLDWSNPIVPVTTSSSLDECMKEIPVKPIPAYVVNHQVNLIDQLKETSGNRDVSQGSTQSGITAATAIAALQEAGAKLPRQLNRVLYRSRRQEDYLKVELIRQFYTEPRSFRLDKDNGDYEFVQYDNSSIRNEDGRNGAVFDIKISAEKQSPFSRAAQNETMKELYGMGMFAPQNAEPALVCLDGMEFEGKDKIKQQIQQNSIFMQQFQMMQQVIMQIDAMNPGLGVGAMVGLGQAPVPDSGGNVPEKEEGTAEERAAKTETDSTRTAKARLNASKQSQIS